MRTIRELCLNSTTVVNLMPVCLYHLARSCFQVEEALVAILSGAAPEGMEFVDVEEEFVIDTATGKGSWKPVVGATKPKTENVKSNKIL